MRVDIGLELEGGVCCARDCLSLVVSEDLWVRLSLSLYLYVSSKTCPEEKNASVATVVRPSLQLESCDSIFEVIPSRMDLTASVELTDLERAVSDD